MRFPDKIVEICVLMKCLFVTVIIVLRLVSIPHTLAFQGAAVLLPISSFDERLTASLAERNIGFTAVVIQGVGIHRHKSGKTEIGCVHHGFDGGLQLDLPGGEIILQSHIQLRYFLDKPLQHQRALCAVRPIPLPEQILLFRHTDTVKEQNQISKDDTSPVLSFLSFLSHGC